jgi:elongation factor Tu
MLPAMFRMTVNGVFSIRGRGTVVAGRIEEGSVSAGDEVRVDDWTTARVESIEVARHMVPQASAGDEAGLLFTSLDKASVQRGSVLTG